MKESTRKKIFIGGGIFTVVLMLFLFSKIAVYIPFLFQLLFNKEIDLKKTDNNVNILLLGIAGGNHDGPNLTDTIIFSTVNPDKNKVTLVSLPRDFWVPETKSKINAAYALGESKRKGGGITLTRAVVSKILDKDIDYVIRIDFAGFTKAVDLIGGLDINVENTFDDFEYPVQGKENDLCGHKEEEIEKLATASSQLESFPCRYETLHFNKGMQVMDGKTALKYVRSRHAKGSEGSDFARSKRQAKVIKAFKDKLLSANTLLNPSKLISLYQVLENSIDTDIKQEEFDDFIRLSRKMKEAKISSAVLDAGDEKTGRLGILTMPDPRSEFGMQWVVIPRLGNGDYSEIQGYVNCEIKGENCGIQKTSTN